ncbi:MAG TPA: DUF4956 domain-containing protein [Pyrinomonadaceae bacterium]|nr:DUF4956 domain-containing protein [Pyrinomonadaceae bacterium]
MNRVSVGVLATFVVILIGSGLLAYGLRERTPAMNPPNHEPALTADTPAPSPREEPLLGQLFGSRTTGLAPSSVASWEDTAAKIALRFSLAAFLAGLLAFRWRRGLSFSRRNPFVAQTQILMAVVAAAMMMVVGDSAARAFGIFAAASLVRFRTNIRDPKEITVLLICLGVGLASGVGRWDMALILALFVLLTLAVLEYFEQSQVFRSMEVTVKTRNVDSTEAVLKKIFAKHKFDAELREIDRPDEDDPIGKVVYLVNLSTSISTDRLNEEVLSADKENIDTVEWKQKESQTYIYK